MLIIAMFAGVMPAYAVPQSKINEARALKREVDRLDAAAEAAGDRYFEAKSHRDNLTAQSAKAAAKLQKVRKRMGTVQTHLNSRASNMYRTGPMGFVDVLLGAKSFDQFARTWDVLSDLNKSDAESIVELRDLKAEADAAHKDLRRKQKAAAKQAGIMLASKRSAERSLSTSKAKLSSANAEIASLVAAERRAEAARRAAQVSNFTSSGGGKRYFPPPRRRPRSEVVAIARQYLGAPYVWAADGPNSFDCSGLTMFVYRQVGVSLPHSSRAQINSGERVSRQDLQPGDLVFFGSPIHHVGIYIGGGMMIHAPQTGDVVKISPLHSNYAGACRP